MASPAIILEYGRPRRGRMRAIAEVVLRLAGVLLAALPIGGALGWLIMPVVYVDAFKVYEDQPGVGFRTNVLATRAAQLESPVFVSAAVAPLIASKQLTTADIQKATVHAEVGRRDDIITVSVEHDDPQMAAAICNALLSAAILGASTPTSSTGPATESADVEMAKALAAVVRRTIVLQTPQPASQLRPQPSRLGWLLLALCVCVPAVIAVVAFRRWIFAIPSAREHEDHRPSK
jgi:hypothetical protein